MIGIYEKQRNAKQSQKICGIHCSEVILTVDLDFHKPSELGKENLIHNGFAWSNFSLGHRKYRFGFKKIEWFLRYKK